MTSKYRTTVAGRAATAFLALPTPILNRVSGVHEPIVVQGRTLHPALSAMVAWNARIRVRNNESSVDRRRAELRALAAVGMPKRTDVRATNYVADLAGVPCRLRVYRPYGLTETHPGIVYYHGGGWVTGDLDTHDGTCRMLAAEANVVVIAVDYRLAPEHPFPAAVLDAIAGYHWAVQHAEMLGIDAQRIGVMGDSAGGELAAAVAQQVTAFPEGSPPPIAQGLIYPATDAHLGTPSVETFGEGFFLSKDEMYWFRGQYLPNEADYEDIRASPLLSPDVSGVPAALVVTAGFDPLCDEGDAYAQRMRDAGVRVLHRRYDDMVHGFFGMGVLPGGMEAITEICQAMGELMHVAR